MVLKLLPFGRLETWYSPFMFASVVGLKLLADANNVAAVNNIINLVLISWLSNIFVKNKYAWIQLEVAPDMGLPNTRSMHFIWVDYMQY